MSTKDTYNTLDSLGSENGEDPFAILEKDRNQHLRGDPTHGEIVSINDRDYIVQTKGSPEGTNVYVFGELVEGEESIFPNNAALKQANGYENQISHALGINPRDTNVEFAEYDTNLDQVTEIGSQSQEVYFKLDGEL